MVTERQKDRLSHEEGMFMKYAAFLFFLIFLLIFRLANQLLV